MQRRVWIPLLMVGIIVAVAPVDAKISKELKAEVLPEIRTGLESNDPLVKRYAVLAGLQLRDKKLDRELVPYLTVTNVAVRRGAIIGFASRGDKKGIAGLHKELVDAKASRFRVMTEVLPALPAKIRLKLLKGWITGKKVEAGMFADALRYCADWGTDAEYALLGTIVKAKDRRPFLKVLRPPRAVAVGWADRMLNNAKDPAARRAGLELALTLATPEVDAVARKAVRDADPGISELAFAHLVKVNDPAASAFLVAKLSTTDGSEFKEVTQRVLDRRAKVPRDVADRLIAEDSGTDAEVTYMLYGLLGLTGEKTALKALVDLEASTVVVDRRKGVAGLGYTGSNDATKILARTLFDGREDIRRDSAVGLGALGDPAGVKPLQAALNRRPDKDMTYRLLRSLGEIKSFDAANALMFKASDPDPEVKRLVLRGLTNIGDKRTVNILEVFTRDKDVTLRFRATLLLMQLDKAKGQRYVQSAFQRPPEDYWDQVVVLPRTLREELIIYLLKSSDERHRTDALDGLGFLGEPGMDMLRKATAEGYPKDVKGAATATLLRHSSDKDMAFFQRMSQDGGDTEKMAAIVWLTRKAGSDHSGFFRTLINGSKDNPARRMAGLYALLKSES